MKLLLQAVFISHKKLPVSLLISIINVGSYFVCKRQNEYFRLKIENNAVFVYDFILDRTLIKGNSSVNPTIIQCGPVFPVKINSDVIPI